MKKPPVRSGFTLLELMVAAGLAVILGAAVAAVFGRGMAAWRRSQARLEQVFVMEKGFRTLGRELRNALILPEGPFEGSKEELRFSVADDETHLTRVRYRLLSQGPMQSFVREAASQSTIVVPHVKDFSIEYGYTKNMEGGTPVVTWRQAWDSTQQPRKLPLLLRVRITAGDSTGALSTVTHEFWIPQGVLRSVPVD